MKSFKIAISLVRIPRLFFSLLFFPLIISLVLVYFQMMGTGLLIRGTANNNMTNFKATMDRLNKKSLVRKIIYGTEDPLPKIKICRWVANLDSSIPDPELPPSKECYPDRLDAALQVSSPEAFDVSDYRKIFDGNVERLHICRTCRPDIVINLKNGEVQTNTYNVFAYWIIKLVSFNTQVQKEYIEAAVKRHETSLLLGDIKLHSKGFDRPISITGILKSLAVIANIVVLIIVALWLALKAHRKVLDYFARNGALLPMVAATGSHSFYSAIWILTIARVIAFLLAAIPLTYFGLKEIMQGNEIIKLYQGSVLELSFWLFAAVVSLGLATLIASIAELKHRHSLLSFTYRYVPLILAVLGSVIWGVTFLVDGSTAAFIRSMTSVLPIIGITPVLIAPVFEPQQTVLVMHALLSLTMLILALKYNARWFAAHLEEI